MKPRVYEGGNIFAELHRQLGSHRPLTDIDFLTGEVCSGFLRIGICDVGEDRRYAEYQTDFGTVEARTTALFDFKYTMTDYIRHSLQPIRTGTALWYYSQLARQLSARAFVVIATDGDLPLAFYEITSGQADYIGDLCTDRAEDVKAFWKYKLQL